MSKKSKGRSQKNGFICENFPKYGWVGWLIPKPAQNTPNYPEIFFFTRISPFVFPNLTKTLGWVCVFTDLEKLSKTKTFFFGGTPSETYLKTEQLFSDTDLSNIRDIKHILILFTKLILILLFFILKECCILCKWRLIDDIWCIYSY